jgi:hypothetical protein
VAKFDLEEILAKTLLELEAAKAEARLWYDRANEFKAHLEVLRASERIRGTKAYNQVFYSAPKSHPLYPDHRDYNKETDE